MGIATIADLNEAILGLHTGYLGRVETISGNTAMVQPLTLYKSTNENAKKRSLASAVIPQNIKFKTEVLRYMVSSTTSATKTILVPDDLAVGDIVFVGICERDITYAKNGVISEATNRHHNINDGVIIRVVR